MHVFGLDFSYRAVEGHARAASNGLRTPDILRAPTEHRHYSMPQPRRRRHPRPDRRARSNCSRHAATAAREAIMLAHGFSIDMMVELVRAGLATARAERVVAGGKPIEVARVRITDAGRRAIGE
jgi:hypothetical protein